MQEGLNIDYVKVSKKLNYSLTEAVKNKSHSSKETVLWNDFSPKEEGSYTAIYANYFYQSFGSDGTFTIYRKTPEQQHYDFICELKDRYDLYDYNVANNAYYHYLVAFKYDNFEGSYKLYQDVDDQGFPVYIKTEWDDFSLCNIEETDDENIYIKTGDVWSIRYNMSNGELTHNNSITTWDTLGRYPKISVGQKNYTGSTITCLIGQVAKHKVRTIKKHIDKDDEEIVREECSYTEKSKTGDASGKYDRETERYAAWQEFVTDGKLKLLKDIKGNSWIVQIMSNPTGNIDYRNHIGPTTISFSWQEVMATDSISIISDLDT